RDLVEERPAGLEELELALQLRLAHRPVLGRRSGKGDAPEVGRAGADALLHDLERPGGVELVEHPGALRNRPVAISVGLERLERQPGCLRAATPARPVEAECDRLL